MHHATGSLQFTRGGEGGGAPQERGGALYCIMKRGRVQHIVEGLNFSRLSLSVCACNSKAFFARYLHSSNGGHLLSTGLVPRGNLRYNQIDG